ncbi:hypothetical protein CH63R_02081 [Colletotrichum higginsianum IMI 349063]|uniref:Uncharacterized protein n=2 Tax=Colletotrichum higginsianum TaxID=80884 RepID=A0A1B7YMR1_COLHI|nr:hypothetical protein CH63R_02081 [Colletotrichum higginsianum IMI 349063]OBR13355.1 hypothetical protein CH63R_02081 [Colletotrichum higginsianum IMI 349063]TID02402.1 hypothetical protein CH35J_003591 [Colletotrichum higginsianum]
MSESPSVDSDTAAPTPLILDDIDAQAPDFGKEALFLLKKLEIVTMHFEADRRVKEAKRLSAAGEIENLRQEVAGLKLKIANLQEETTITKMKVRAMECWAAGLKHAAQAPHFGPDVNDGKPQAP